MNKKKNTFTDEVLANWCYNCNKGGHCQVSCHVLHPELAHSRCNFCKKLGHDQNGCKGMHRMLLEKKEEKSKLKDKIEMEKQWVNIRIDEEKK